MNRFILGLDKVLSILGKALVGLLAGGIIVSVILRYVFSIAFVSSEELLTMVFVATTFFGAALGLREGEHIAVTSFVSMMPEKLKKVCAILAQAFIIIVSCVMIYYSIRIIRKVGGIPSPATGIRRGIFYSYMPVTFAITIFYSIVNILKLFVHIDDPVKGYKEDFELGMELTGGEE
jgi:TRAP-type C4-dicarboxylate transport system permease small subunit